MFILCSQIFSWIVGRHLSQGAIFLCVLSAIMVLFQAFSRYLFYWDIDSEGLHQRHFGSKKDFSIAWDKVLCVRSAIPGVTWDGTVAVYYDHPESKLGFKYLVTTPEHRKRFIAALREYAPKATYKI
jgi:hypothetical protein